MIKNGGQALIGSLVIGYVPRLWKRANIVPDRNHSICKDYRPISLLSGVGKLGKNYYNEIDVNPFIHPLIVMEKNVLVVKQASMQITKLLHSSKSPFEKWKEPTSPIKGITTMVGSEIEAIRQALEKVQFQYKDERVLILSYCKFAVNAIRNKCNSETYNFPIAECQKLMKELGDGVPEIYWIKGHSGNERADAVAKRARFQEEFEQPELFRKPDKSAPFLNFHGLNPFFTEEWNRYWTN
ncbi:hypothetical protein RFI_00260 [Reticulomyxa filosa]|uniref:RNase H type-1 domain-containing protein n=1 Tax=Reticulomyxa filosa TaxID=46433 RepID=X6PGI8_RETFI|nr:hypothetical protein RFI_00260 [Reticulomyxa filosa]|eukprot:ETO36802.1 hypothetical protein RFI_00260 [Reticulomyxa filosa]